LIGQEVSTFKYLPTQKLENLSNFCYEKPIFWNFQRNQERAYFGRNFIFETLAIISSGQINPKQRDSNPSSHDDELSVPPLCYCQMFVDKGKGLP
jgi:hypothetical protein